MKLALLAALVDAFGPAAAAPADLAAQMPARILAAHNKVRADAGAPPLVWDRALGDAAANYAVYLALTNSFQHSDQSHRQDTGENLWMGTRGAFSFEAMVAGWSSERRDFVPGVFPAVSRNGAWEKVGHYTQMVWPATTKVGCAVASNATSDFLVCRYSPAGNVIGRPLLTSASAPIGH
jgi:hypothetical protein